MFTGHKFIARVPSYLLLRLEFIKPSGPVFEHRIRGQEGGFMLGLKQVWITHLDNGPLGTYFFKRSWTVSVCPYKLSRMEVMYVLFTFYIYIRNP